MHAEARAVQLALSVAISRGWNITLLSFDSLLLMEAIRDGTNVPREIVALVDSIRNKSKLFDVF